MGKIKKGIVTSPPITKQSDGSPSVPNDFPSKNISTLNSFPGIVRHKAGCGSVGHQGACVVVKGAV